MTTRRRWIVVSWKGYSPTVIGPFKDVDIARQYGNDILADEYNWEIADPYAPNRWAREKAK